MKRLMFVILYSLMIHVYAHAQIGKVGINTSSPVAMLHVKDSSVVFTGINPPPGTGNPPVSGVGTRMMWYSNKAALRAGNVSGTQWDKDNIGLYSMAFGQNTKAIGTASTALGNGTIASGLASTAMGQFTIASGAASIASGVITTANGNNSTSMGDHTIARSYASLAIGKYNDTTNMSSIASWVDTDPVFVIGNGSANNTRANAFTVLKNGNVGIGTFSPQKLLHISSGASGATPTSSAVGVFENNLDVSINLITPNTEESAIYFGNPANAIHGGIVYNSTVANGLDFRTNGNVTRAVINNVGDMGIGDNSPNARLHVSDGTGGGMYNSGAELIIEDDAASYIQFSNPVTSEAGILSGNGTMSTRSALIFRPDSSVQIRAGGNTTRITVTKTGNVGIGTTSPAAKLDVIGNTNTSGEIQRTSTGGANMVPICYGSVTHPNVINSGTGNFSVVQPVGEIGKYEITITGETYTNAGYVTSVVSTGGDPRFSSCNESNGKLVIQFYWDGGLAASSSFHFIVYKQ